MAQNKYSGMGQKRQKHSRRYSGLTYSLLGHGLIVFCLFISAFFSPSNPSATPTRLVAKSTLVSQSTVDREIARIRSERTERMRSERRQLRALEARKKRLSRHVSAQRKALSRNREQLSSLKKNRQQAKRRLDNLQKAQRLAAQKMAKQKKVMVRLAAELKSVKAKRRRAHNAAEKKRLQREAARLAAQLERQSLQSEQQRIISQARMNAALQAARAQILAAIQAQWVVPKQTPPGSRCVFSLQLSPRGAVSHLTLLRSSGSPVLDRSARIAILRASPLPVPTNPELKKRFQTIRLTVRPIRSGATA